MTEDVPEGFALETEFLDTCEKMALIEFAGARPFGEVRIHGVAAKRRVAQFGWRYSFESYRLTPGPPVPFPLLDVRERASTLAKVDAN